MNNNVNPNESIAINVNNEYKLATIKKQKMKIQLQQMMQNNKKVIQKKKIRKNKTKDL